MESITEAERDKYRRFTRTVSEGLGLFESWAFQRACSRGSWCRTGNSNRYEKQEGL